MEIMGKTIGFMMVIHPHRNPENGRRKKNPDLEWTDVLIYNANHGRSLVKIKWSYDLELNFCFLQ